MKRYKKYMVLVLALLFAACLPINSIASEWEIESPWKKVGTNTTLAVPTDNVGIGMEIPNNRLQVIELINFNNPIRGTLLGFQAGRVNTGSDNSFIGFNAGFSNTTGFNNTFTGSNAGLWNTIGGSNTFTGVNAGFSNTTGNSNTFTGVGAGFSNTTGGDNTFTGVNTGRANTTGGGNTFIGREAGRTNTTGSSNTFTGMQVGFSNTIGVNNTFTGLQAGFSNTTGNSNTFTGVQAGVFNTTGLDNTFTGVNAGRSNTTGISNTFTGTDAGRSNATGNQNTFTGLGAGFSNTTGSFNTFTGLGAGFSNTTGSFNTFTGQDAGPSNTTGANNTFTGIRAGFSNTTGSFNTFTGLDAGRSNTTGSSNTFTGISAGFSNTTGANNTFTGISAGFSNISGFSNTFTGMNAGLHLADGAVNQTSNNSVFMGNDTRASAAGNTNEIVIGANAIGGGSNTITLGNTSIVRTIAAHLHTTGTTRGLGGAQILVLPTPGAPIVAPQGVLGTTTWGYRITARSSVGETLASTAGIATTGNAILSLTNFNRITWTAVFGAVDYRIYRTTAGGTPSTTGLIGTVTLLTFDDTGLVATTAVPTIDSSGNFGIGTATPNSLTQIIGTTDGEGPTFGGAGSILHLRQNAPWTGRQPWALFVDGYSWLGGFRIFGGGGPRALLQTVVGSPLGFATTGNDPIIFSQLETQERMRIASDGNIIIGATTPAMPATRLHVVGTTRGVGGAQILSLPTPGAPTVTPQGTTGTTTWGYRITARSSVGETLASTAGIATTGNAILSLTNFNRITWTAVFGAVDYRIYRTTAGGTPSTTGLIGTVTLLTFDDTGLVATTAVPTIDSSVNVGIGTMTPAVGNRLEVHDGHIVNTMTTPPGVTCNVGIPSIIGTDMGGAITTPATATSCTITFNIPWNEVYACVVSASTSTAAPFVSALSATAATFGYVTTGTPILYYFCSGR